MEEVILNDEQARNFINSLGFIREEVTNLFYSSYPLKCPLFLLNICDKISDIRNDCGGEYEQKKVVRELFKYEPNDAI